MLLFIRPSLQELGSRCVVGNCKGLNFLLKFLEEINIAILPVFPLDIYGKLEVQKWSSTIMNNKKLLRVEFETILLLFHLIFQTAFTN